MLLFVSVKSVKNEGGVTKSLHCGNIARSLCKKDCRNERTSSDQFVSIHAKTEDFNQACKLSLTVLITMLISTSLLCLSSTNANSAATVSKSRLCWAQMPHLPTRCMCFEDTCVRMF